MFVFGGLLFGGGVVGAVGNLMGLSSGDMSNAVAAGLVGGLGLALLLVAQAGGDS
ncbi:MAG: hypothetical protein QOK42_575 [Frankiaceae bacterium]|nr:hypothetical protein [Frankiaceae bacterium]MDX6225937.1 hypothetical protein [Frankiales bacterium]